MAGHTIHLNDEQEREAERLYRELNGLAPDSNLPSGAVTRMLQNHILLIFEAIARQLSHQRGNATADIVDREITYIMNEIERRLKIKLDGGQTKMIRRAISAPGYNLQELLCIVGRGSMTGVGNPDGVVQSRLREYVNGLVRRNSTSD